MVPEFDEKLMLGRTRLFRGMKPYAHAIAEQDVGSSGFDLYQAAVRNRFSDGLSDEEVGVFPRFPIVPGQLVRGMSDRHSGDPFAANGFIDLPCDRHGFRQFHHAHSSFLDLRMAARPLTPGGGPIIAWLWFWGFLNPRSIFAIKERDAQVL
jgi:hypothetical protein